MDRDIVIAISIIVPIIFISMIIYIYIVIKKCRKNKLSFYNCCKEMFG